jgi:Undecaprenyl-phosphate glucose phosphotransferase
LAIAGTCFLTSVIYFKTALTQWPPIFEYVTAAFLIAALVLLPALGFKQYNAIQARARDRFMWGGMGAVIIAFAAFLSILFLFKIANWYSRGTFFLQFLGVSAVLLISRGLIHGYVCRAIRSGNVEARRAVLIGDAKANRDILNNLEQFGVRWAGILPMPVEPIGGGSADELSSNHKRQFIEQCRRLKPDDIVFLAVSSDLWLISLLSRALSELPVSVHVIPVGADELWRSATMANLAGTVTIQVSRPPLSSFDLAVKRGIDVCVAILALIALSPLLLTVAIAIKLDSSGPILFWQNRHGYNNEIIPVMKFRSMTVVEDGETTNTFTQAKANDARLTRFGRILRRTNIDELPQLLNVLRGEMSIIGPRPHPIALNAMFQDRISPFSRRHNVKPGLTGWAQVNGFRGETDTLEKMRRRIEYDLYYIDNWSLMFDVKIALMTLFSKHAYTNAV